MSDFITSLLSGFTLGSFLIGLLANFSTQGISEKYQQIKKNNKFINHDLQRAVKRSFLGAIKGIVSECQKEKNCSGNDIKWLEQKQADVKDALKRLEKIELKQTDVKDTLNRPEKIKLPDMLLESLREIELLLKPSGGILTEQLLQIVEKKLVAQAVKDDAAAPACYKDKFKTDLFARTDFFKRMCDCFAWEIKNMPEVRRIFDSQTLAQIDNRLVELEKNLQSLRPSTPGITVELDADFNKLSIPELWAVIEKLQGIVKGKMTGIEAGSVKIFLEGTSEGIEQLESLFRSGELSEILGVPVKDVSIRTAPSCESKPSADAGEEGIIEKTKAWLSSLLWIPEGAGLPVTAADTSEQEKTFETDEGEFTVTCVWEGEIKEHSAYIWLSWKAEIKPDVEFVIQFLNPATKEVRYEICPGKLRKGTATLKKEKLGFDPTKEPWGIYVEVKERKPE